MKYLDRINSLNDFKKLNIEELPVLAKEIREFLVDVTSKNGGHLSSNLGVVELSIALEYVFDTSVDKLIFDVGHQSYVHKILTGRKNDFDTLRKLGGLSGFPKMSESIYDAFDTGHSTTSISLANGFCTARDLLKHNYNVIALIGDGAMTGGMAFEALNNIGRSKQKAIVILNDNQMSISENVGAISKTLSNVRISEKYVNLKSEINLRLSDNVTSNKYVKNSLKYVKDKVKKVLVDGELFEQMGFTYIVVDGHDIKEIIKTLNRVKSMNEPILIHVNTTKGKGYKFAEEDSSKFHGISPFDKETGEVLEKGGVSYSNVVGEKFLSVMKKNKKVVLVSAAMTSGTGISKIQNIFSERVFDVGICEQHATTYCAGMSKAGLIPVFLVYSTFLQRSYDQILHDVCITNRHVIFMIDRAGIVGADGETHQGIFDISFLSHMPNMTILAPKSKEELEMAIEFAVNHNGPIAIRYPRGNAFTFAQKSDIILGEAEQVFEGGDDVLIVSVGHMFETALMVNSQLNQANIKSTLINARFVKPIDEKIAKDCNKYKKIVTIEENVYGGSFSQALASMLLENGFTGKYIHCTLPDKFIEQGTQKELRKIYGLDCDTIVNRVLEN